MSIEYCAIGTSAFEFIYGIDFRVDPAVFQRHQGSSVCEGSAFNRISAGYRIIFILPESDDIRCDRAMSQEADGIRSFVCAGIDGERTVHTELSIGVDLPDFFQKFFQIFCDILTVGIQPVFPVFFCHFYIGFRIGIIAVPAHFFQCRDIERRIMQGFQKIYEILKTFVSVSADSCCISVNIITAIETVIDIIRIPDDIGIGFHGNIVKGSCTDPGKIFSAICFQCRSDFEFPQRLR